MATYYSREKKFVVVGYSDIVSFLNCHSSANFFAALQMNGIRSKNMIYDKIE